MYAPLFSSLNLIICRVLQIFLKNLYHWQLIQKLFSRGDEILCNRLWGSRCYKNFFVKIDINS